MSAHAHIVRLDEKSSCDEKKTHEKFYSVNFLYVDVLKMRDNVYALDLTSFHSVFFLPRTHPSHCRIDAE